MPRRPWLVGLAFAVVAWASPAQADTLFSQPYAGPAPGVISDAGPGQLVADDFTLLTPATLTAFHWWGAYAGVWDPADAPADAWTLTLYPDLASLQSFTNGTAVSLDNLTRTFTGEGTSASGVAIFFFTADVGNSVTLGVGTYYALLVGNTGPNLSAWISVPNTGSGRWTRSAGGITWSQDPDYGQAFEIIGTPVPDPASTLLLLGMGVAGLAAWRKRRR